MSVAAPPIATATAEGAGTGLLDWAVRYAAPLLTAAGVVLYGMLRLAYVFFYIQLRATPQEVGYGYLEILSCQMVGTVELVLLLAAVLFLPVLGWLLLRHGRRLDRRTVVRSAVRCVVPAGVLVLALLPSLAWLQGTEARRGNTVRNVYLKHAPRIPVLAVQAVPATAAWSAEVPDGLVDLRDRHCLLYLGQNATTTVFYDVQTRDSLRVPTGQIVVLLKNTRSVPRGC